MLNVHDENLHIINDRAKGFPEPEITVDDAWNEMKSILDAEMPHSTIPSSGANLKGGVGHFLNSLLIVLGFAGALTLAILYFTNKSDKSENLSEPNYLIPDSVSVILQNEDSNIFLTQDHFNLRSSASEKTVTELKNPRNSKPVIMQIPEMNFPVDVNYRSEPEKEIQNSDLLINPDQSITINKDVEILGTDSMINKQDYNVNNTEITDALPSNDKKAFDVYSGDSTALKPSKLAKMNQTNNQKNRNLRLMNSSAKQGKNKPGKTQTNPLTVRDQFRGKTHFGLQWGTHLPFQGTSYYFSGYDGKGKLFQSFIPGAWLSYKSNKDEIMLQFHPFHHNFTGSREIVMQELNNGNTQDSISIINKSTILNKTFGPEGWFQYNYHLNRSWMIGTGVGFNFQRKALLKDRIINRTNGVILSDSLYSIGESSPLWNYISPGYFTGKLEIVWVTKNLDIGANLTLPFTDLLRESGESPMPLNGQVFLRLKIR